MDFPFLSRHPMAAAVLALGLALSACSAGDAVPPDATVHPVDAAVPAPDLPTAPDVAPMPDAGSFPDVHEVCQGAVTDTCPLAPPGPCPDLADGRVHPVVLTGLHHDLTLSCAGRLSATGPDAVLPLTVTVTSDVVIAVTASDGDAAIVALKPAAACSNPMGELACTNGSFGINGTGVIQQRNVPPGVYTVVVANAHGGPMTVQATVTPAPVRPAGTSCPGLQVVPDGPTVMVNTHDFPPEASYGTSCGGGPYGPLGFMEAVFNYTLTTARDVTLTVGGTDGMVSLDVSALCGSRAQALPGCASGMPATRTIHNQPPGTYYVVADYEVVTVRTQTLTAAITTAPPSPPGPAAQCPGLPLTMGMPSLVDIGTLTPGDTLACIPRQRVGAVFSLVAPATGDVMVHVTAPTGRDDAALELHTPCTGDIVGACVGPMDRASPSVWARYQGLTAGTTYSVRAATSATSGMLSARYYAVPTAARGSATGNETCAGAVTVPSTGGIFTGTTAAATALTTPSCATSDTGCGGSRGVVYRLDLATQQRVVAVMTSPDFDALLAIQSGAICPGTPVTNGCNDDTYSTNPQVDLTLMPGTYWIVAGGCGPMAVGRYTLDVAVVPPPTM